MALCFGDQVRCRDFRGTYEEDLQTTATRVVSVDSALQHVPGTLIRRSPLVGPAHKRGQIHRLQNVAALLQARTDVFPLMYVSSK